jgi:hypothetical protein
LYIYGWNGNGEIDYQSAPELEIGRWILTKDWKGAVVESSELPSTDNQYKQLKSLMGSVAGFYQTQLH